MQTRHPCQLPACITTCSFSAWSQILAYWLKSEIQVSTESGQHTGQYYEVWIHAHNHETEVSSYRNICFLLPTAIGQSVFCLGFSLYILIKITLKLKANWAKHSVSKSLPNLTEMLKSGLEHARSGQLRSYWLGQVRLYQDRSGQVRSGEAKSG